jgi:TnpA family transposase
MNLAGKASLILRKIGSYPRQNGFAVALRELGKIERTLYTLDWLQNVELRRRVNAGLNKGEARNALARAVFLNRLGEMRDRTALSGKRSESGCCSNHSMEHSVLGASNSGFERPWTNNRR